MESNVVEMLKGANINKMNPRRVPFLEPQKAELNELGQYADPWGNPYEYKSPGEHGDYDIISYGADGAPGGEGEDKDIVNWKDIDR
jgi:type II secretion system protein G